MPTIVGTSLRLFNSRERIVPAPARDDEGGVGAYLLKMRNLFDTPPLPGLKTDHALVTPEEEAALIAQIDAVDLKPFLFQGWLGKRLTHSFGWNYDFDRASFAPAEPIPPWLDPLRERAAAFADLPAAALVQVLLIRYDPGAAIGWHKDRPVFDQVVGVSLGNAATMRFRRRTAAGFERRNVPLAPRSVYHLAQAARHDWEHSIAPLDVPRWSVTFRSLR